MDPQSPSLSLPPIRTLAACSFSAVAAALINLRALYWPASLRQTSLHSSKLQTEKQVPDSGYASAEEDGEDEGEEEERREVLRADALERAFAVRWLTGFIARSEEWIEPSQARPSLYHDLHKDWENRARVVEEAVSLLALCADTRADGTLARRFSFVAQGGGEVTVELWDESYEQDHESVGLQTWGSARVLAGRVCADPGAFGLMGKVRVLELGAGTGLLSMVVAKLGTPDRDLQLEVVATDFHAAVLENLRGNVARNFVLNASPVRVEELDWAEPHFVEERDKYDVILAADVIYDKRHGGWIKNCAEEMLKPGKGAVMWMIVPRRPTREGEVDGIESTFADGGMAGLRILEAEEVERVHGVGRADEAGYKLFRIGWA